MRFVATFGLVRECWKMLRRGSDCFFVYRDNCMWTIHQFYQFLLVSFFGTSCLDTLNGIQVLIPMLSCFHQLSLLSSYDEERPLAGLYIGTPLCAWEAHRLTQRGGKAVLAERWGRGKINRQLLPPRWHTPRLIRHMILLVHLLWYFFSDTSSLILQPYNGLYQTRYLVHNWKSSTRSSLFHNFKFGQEVFN